MPDPVLPVFKLGDVVRLKSGGPPITVYEMLEDTDGTLKVKCVWFQNLSVARDVFDAVTLVSP